jgi:hypothetical protein
MCLSEYDPAQLDAQVCDQADQDLEVTAPTKTRRRRPHQPGDSLFPSFAKQNLTITVKMRQDPIPMHTRVCASRSIPLSFSHIRVFYGAMSTRVSVLQHAQRAGQDIWQKKRTNAGEKTLPNRL